MRTHTIRGANQIGGSIIEVADGSTRLILDVGSELGESVPQAPLVDGLFQGEPDCDGVLLSHYHSDHLGLIDEVLPGIPIFMGEGALRIYEAACSYVGKDVRENIQTFRPDVKFTIGDISATPILCDHSAFDSYMFFLESGGKSILYTGDFRSNGRKSFEALLHRLPHADVLITEGTTLSGSHSLTRSEADLEEEAVRAINAHEEAPVFINMAATNIDRIVTAYKAAKRTGRVFLMDVYTATIARAAGGSIPRPGDFDDVRVFLTHPTDENHELLESFGRAKIGRSAIARERFVMTVRPSMKGYLQKLSNLLEFEGSLLLYSLWSGYLDQQSTADFIDYMRSKGVDIESLHTSGHADSTALKALVEHVNPSILLPVHTENASWFKKFDDIRVLSDAEDVVF